MFKKWCVLSVLLVFGISACTSKPTYSFSFGSSLKSQGQINFDVILEFENILGLNEFVSKFEKIKFALTLAFRQQNASDLKVRGKARITNSFRKISKQLLKEKIVTVKIDNLFVNSK